MILCYVLQTESDHRWILFERKDDDWIVVYDRAIRQNINALEQLKHKI